MTSGGAVELGRARLGVRADRAVTLVNDHGDAIDIEGLVTSCGCIQADLSGPSRLSPSATTRLDLSLLPLSSGRHDFEVHVVHRVVGSDARTTSCLEVTAVVDGTLVGDFAHFYAGRFTGDRVDVEVPSDGPRTVRRSPLDEHLAIVGHLRGTLALGGSADEPAARGVLAVSEESLYGAVEGQGVLSDGVPGSTPSVLGYRVLAERWPGATTGEGSFRVLLRQDGAELVGSGPWLPSTTVEPSATEGERRSETSPGSSQVEFSGGGSTWRHGFRRSGGDFPGKEVVLVPCTRGTLRYVLIDPARVRDVTLGAADSR